MSQLQPSICKEDHIRGNKNAPITLVEYGDYQCPYCGRAYPIVEAILDIEGSRLKFVFRHFPLSQIHPNALHAAYAAEAAGLQGKFWEMHGMLFQNQQALEDQDLVAYALALNLDKKKFEVDMFSTNVARKVRNDFMSGIRSGVNGTPTFFINGWRYDGSYEFEYLLAAIKSEEQEFTSGRAVL